MNQYLLATHSVADEAPGPQHSPEGMQQFMERVVQLEAEMDDAGVFVFGGALFDPGSATVFSVGDAGVTASDGPRSSSVEQLAGFYIINAADDAAARTWAEKVAAATQRPIEMRAFRATGRVADHMDGGAG